MPPLFYFIHNWLFPLWYVIVNKTKAGDNMSKIRVHKNGNFTVMSNYHFKERGLSLKAKGLLSLMLSLPDTWNYSVSGLVTLSKDGKDSVMSALAELEKFGYLTRERVKDSKGQFAGVEYNIFEEPQQKKPIEEKPILDKSNEEKPTAEKPRLLNTNQLSTNSIKDIKGLNKNINDLDSVLESIINHDLRELYTEYVDMRKSINAPLTKRGLEKLIDRCERLTNNNVNLQKLLLETAIINNWKNVYLPNEAEIEAANKVQVKELKGFFGLE